MIRNFGLVFGIVVLAACQPVETPTQARDLIDPATCGADQYMGLVGQDVTALEKVLILGKVRVIRPDDIVTMDFRPDRINFMIGPDERIREVRCG